MKKFFEEFKVFALKGNMMDMAIGVIIGGAFSALVTSLTDNLISPILGILGKVNFDAMMWDVFGDGKLVFKYGAFITAVINFLIMAFVLFCIVKAMNKLMDMGKHEEPAAEEPAVTAFAEEKAEAVVPEEAPAEEKPKKKTVRNTAAKKAEKAEKKAEKAEKKTVKKATPKKESAKKDTEKKETPKKETKKKGPAKSKKEDQAE